MATIGIFDSGCGGLSVFREIRRILPDERYVYYADNAWCPYGEKPAEVILERCREICRLLLEKGADVIVIACNTATSAAISTLRKEFSVPFVGMEPAVKPAVVESRSGVIGVLATAGTLRGNRYREMKELWGSGVRIEERPGTGFVGLVERGELNGERAADVCRESLLPLLKDGADVIVLGCTHYPFLLPVLKQVACEEGYPGVRFIDPAPAVAHRVKEILGAAPRGSGFEIELLSSGSGEALIGMYGNL